MLLVNKNKMNVMVLPKLFAKRVHCTSLHAVYLLNKYKHLIKWENNPSILEFGFADGSTSEAALQRVIPKDYKEFIVADISQKMVEYAVKNKKLPQRGKIIEFDVGSQNIPSELHNRFDHIFSFFTLHIIPKACTSRTLRNIHTMLKPGGQSFHVFCGKSPLDVVFNHLSKHPKWGEYEHDKMISPYYLVENRQSSCRMDLLEAGFRDIEIRVDEFNYEFPDEEAWKENYIAVNAVRPFIPPEELDEYTKYYYKQIEEMVLIKDATNNRFPKVEFATLVTSAKKL